MTPALFAGLFFHFMLLSLIAIGGFMATLPGMYSYLVDTAGLLTPETFAKTVAFGQSRQARMYWLRQCLAGQPPVLWVRSLLSAELPFLSR